MENTKFIISVIGQSKHGKATLTKSVLALLATGDYKRDYSVVAPEGKNVAKFAYGLSESDGAILVISADEGPMPGTRDDIIFARQMGVPKIILFINKTDLIEDTELIDLIETEGRELLARYGFDGENTVSVRGSATSALKGAEDSIKAIKDLIVGMDKTFTDKRVAATPGQLSKQFKCDIYALPNAEGGRRDPMKTGDVFDLVFAMGTASGKTTLPKNVAELFPGDSCNAWFCLDSKIATQVGQRFVVQEGGITVGAGRVVEIDT